LKTITLAIDDDVLEASREYARIHNTTLDGLVCVLLEQTVRQDPRSNVEGLFRVMDEHPGDSAGWKSKREDLHKRQDLF
jgi:hypothetical protein